MPNFPMSFFAVVGVSTDHFSYYELLSIPLAFNFFFQPIKLRQLRGHKLSFYPRVETLGYKSYAPTELKLR